MVCNPKSLMNVPDFLKSLMNVPDFRKTLINVPDCLKKYTSASRKRVTHTKQMKLRDKGSIVSTTHYVFKCLQTCQRKAFNSNVLV